MNEGTRNRVVCCLLVVATGLALAAAWNGAVVSSRSALAESPPTLGEWATFLGTAGGSLLSLLTAGLTWFSKHWKTEIPTFVNRWLPVLQTMLDVQSGREIAVITISFVDGKSPAVLHVADPETQWTEEE